MADAPGAPQVRVFANLDRVAEAAADLVVASLRAGIEARGVAHLALTGGSTAEALHRRLADPPRRTALDWSRVHLWWGDERLVPFDDPLSNAGSALRTLLGGDGGGADQFGLALPPDHVHPIPVPEALALAPDPDAAAARAAAAYAAELLRLVDRRGTDLPRFDLVLLGMGPDGHILSCFPGSRAFADRAPLVLGVPAPTTVAPHVARVTLNPRLVSAAAAVVVMVGGAAKAAVVADALGGPRHVELLPAQVARRAGATWLLDRAAAGGLPSEPTLEP